VESPRSPVLGQRRQEGVDPVEVSLGAQALASSSRMSREGARTATTTFVRLPTFRSRRPRASLPAWLSRKLATGAKTPLIFPRRRRCKCGSDMEFDDLQQPYVELLREAAAKVR
jgi:hypothetical protein